MVAEGTPETVAAHPDSFTGQFLAPLLKGREAKQPARMRPAAEAPTGRHSPLKKTAPPTAKKPAKKRAAKKAAVK